MATIKNILVNESTLKEHMEAQTNNYLEYLAQYLLLKHEYGVEFSIIKKARILAAAMTRSDKQFAKLLLQDRDYDVATVLKTCEILDSRRLYNQMEKKKSTLKNPYKLSKHGTFMANLKKLFEDEPVSLTKSKIKFLKKEWIQAMSSDDLEYYALLFPMKSWKRIVDLFHLKPSDFNLEWFSNYIFTGELPETSMVTRCKNMTSDNVLQLVTTVKPPYSYLRANHQKLITPAILKEIARYTDLDEIIRFWETFSVNQETVEMVYGRFSNGEEPKMPYGELMKRIQVLKNDPKCKHVSDVLLDYAQKKLSSYELSIEQPVVVLGDASASMDVAIRTSSIIASILCSICDAKLHLFRNVDQPIVNPPRDVNSVIDMCDLFKAGNTTAPAASIYPYLQRKEVVKTFIIVTDEVENCDYSGSWHSYGKTTDGFFAPLFKQYRETVYPAKLVFVSFLPDNKDGQMVKHLKEVIPGIEKEIIQFRLDVRKPDLRKLDYLLNTLSMSTGTYDQQKDELIKNIETEGVGSTIFSMFKNGMKELDNDIMNITITI